VRESSVTIIESEALPDVTFFLDLTDLPFIPLACVPGIALPFIYLFGLTGV
jgi:hypothetical protein